MTARTIGRPGRNEPCPCGSGRKYKQCCLEKDDALASTARAAAAVEETAPSAVVAAVPTRAPKHHTQQPWKKATSRGFLGARARHVRSAAAEHSSSAPRFDRRSVTARRTCRSPSDRPARDLRSHIGRAAGPK